MHTRDPQVGKCAVRQDAELRGQADGTGGRPTADGLPVGETTSPPDDDGVMLATFWSWPTVRDLDWSIGASSNADAARDSASLQVMSHRRSGCNAVHRERL